MYEENQLLKQKFADLNLERQASEDIVQKTIKPNSRRNLARYVMQEYRLSERQACGMLKLSRLSISGKKEQGREDRKGFTRTGSEKASMGIQENS